MKFTFLSTLLLLCLVAGLGLSCNHDSYGADDKSKLRVAIVFDIGGKDDRSFNASAWAGVRCAQIGKWPDGTECGKPALPIVARDIEPGNPTSIEPAMRAFAERGYDLIIGIGFAQTPIMELVAKDYPNIRFAIVDGVSDLPNVASLVFKEHEGSYLVGMLAAKASKTGTLGFIGGMDIPLIHRFELGYEEGARAVNPNIRVLQNYVGVTDHAWNNPGKGKELALAQIGKGADVIFTAAGNSGLGAFDAVEQAGTKGRSRHAFRDRCRCESEHGQARLRADQHGQTCGQRCLRHNQGRCERPVQSRASTCMDWIRMELPTRWMSTTNCS